MYTIYTQQQTLICIRTDKRRDPYLGQKTLVSRRQIVASNNIHKRTHVRPARTRRRE